MCCPRPANSVVALQVLVNLIGNAVRYSPRDGMVWIRAERENGVAAVIVADQGKGSRSRTRRASSRSSNVSIRASRAVAGWGSISPASWHARWSGDVTVDSAPGQGARFVFTLPYRGIACRLASGPPKSG